jgi:protein ImuB
MVGVILAAEGSDPAVVLDVAREFSPRLEVCGAREVSVDLDGLSKLFGDARTIAHEIRRTAADKGLRVRVAIAGTRTAARLLVRHRAGLTVVEPGEEPAALAGLPIELLTVVAAAPVSSPASGLASGIAPGVALSPAVSRAGVVSRLTDPGADAQVRAAREHAAQMDALHRTFRQWGLRTLGEVAALPADQVSARMGQPGVEWQRLARGEDPRPLVPAVPEERFEQALDLEWPIEGLEPLSFVLGRLMEPLSAHLERRDRGAAVLHVWLHLVSKAVHARTLQLPTPMRDARTLRTLALLDLESHPPGAAIDRVVVAVDPTPGRIVQYSLLTRPLPAPEQLSTLMARLGALMGEDRCGSPVPVDSWRPGAFAMKAFAPTDDVPAPSGSAMGQGAAIHVPPVTALRRYRQPVPARVVVEHDAPVRVTTDRRGLPGGRVTQASGPWRTSGGWWDDESAAAPAAAPVAVAAHASVTPPAARPAPHTAVPAVSWDRDEWDVTLGDGATYRLFRHRGADAWFVDGVVD